MNPDPANPETQKDLSKRMVDAANERAVRVKQMAPLNADSALAPSKHTFILQETV